MLEYSMCKALHEREENLSFKLERKISEGIYQAQEVLNGLEQEVANVDLY